MAVPGPWQAAALFCRELCLLAGCLVHRILHREASQPWALLEPPPGNTPRFAEPGTCPAHGTSWVAGAGEAAVFIRIPSVLEKHPSEAFLEAPGELLQLPCRWSPARPSFFLFFAGLAPPGLAGRKQQGFQAIFHACNGAEPLFCQKVFYVFIVFLAVQLPFFGTSDQLQMTSLVPDRRARAGGGRNGSCPMSPGGFTP